jgi:hypothetical protein
MAPARSPSLHSSRTLVLLRRPSISRACALGRISFGAADVVHLPPQASGNVGQGKPARYGCCCRPISYGRSSSRRPCWCIHSCLLVSLLPCLLVISVRPHKFRSFSCMYRCSAVINELTFLVPAWHTGMLDSLLGNRERQSESQSERKWVEDLTPRWTHFTNWYKCQY